MGQHAAMTVAQMTLTGAERAAVGLAARRLHDAGPMTSPEFHDRLDALLAVVSTIAAAHEQHDAS